MTTIEARQMLLTYRPWADEAERAEFAAAIAVCQQDYESARWFENHCAVQNAIHTRLRSIPCPEGLKEQIISERKIRASALWLRQPAWLAVAAVVVIVAVATALWQAQESPEDEISFAAFRGRMVGMALRSYAMDFETNDVTQIRAYLAARQGHSDYLLPKGMAQTQSVGCGVLSWQNQRVTMICFRTGQPLKPGEKSDLFLFVMDRNAVSDPPRAGPVEISNVKTHVTASWSDQDRVYLLTSPVDDTHLRRFL